MLLSILFLKKQQLRSGQPIIPMLHGDPGPISCRSRQGEQKEMDLRKWGRCRERSLSYQFRILTKATCPFPLATHFEGEGEKTEKWVSESKGAGVRLWRGKREIWCGKVGERRGGRRRVDGRKSE